MPISKMKKEQAARVAAVRSQEAARSREAVQKRRQPPAPARQKVANIFSVYSVLTTIAKLLPVNKLLKLRTTSTEWNTAFSQELVKRSTRFHLIRSDPDSFYSFSPVLQEYTSYWRESVTVLTPPACAKFLTRQEIKFFYNQPNELERVRHEMFALPFSKLEEVYFDFFADEFEPNPIIPPLTPIHPLPSVRKLELQLSDCDEWMHAMSMNQPPEPIQQFIEEIVQSCTCLQVLVLPTDLPSVTCRIWRLLPPTLTELHINQHFSDLHARTMSEIIRVRPRFHLTSLNVSVIGGGDERNQVEADFQSMLQSLSLFLLSQVGSLLHLQLQGCSDFGEFELFLPTMPRLRSFASEPDCSHDRDCRKPTLVFEKGSLDLNYPNLTQLKHSSRVQPYLPTAVPLPGLRKLVLSGSIPSTCRVFSPFTSNLTHLKLRFWVSRSKCGFVFGELMELVCTSWPLLEELYLAIDLDTSMDVEGAEPKIDELLTGVSEEFHTKPPAEFVKSRPGIGDLHHLRKFIWGSHENGWKVGDVTGYYCFSNPESRLQVIKINQSAISAECEDAIRKNLGMACVLQLRK